MVLVSYWLNLTGVGPGCCVLETFQTLFLLCSDSFSPRTGLKNVTPPEPLSTLLHPALCPGRLALVEHKTLWLLLGSADGRDWQEIQGQERGFEVFIFLVSCLLGYGLAASLYLRLLAGGSLLLLLFPCSSDLGVNSAASSEYCSIPCKFS